MAGNCCTEQCQNGVLEIVTCFCGTERNLKGILKSQKRCLFHLLPEYQSASAPQVCVQDACSLSGEQIVANNADI